MSKGVQTEEGKGAQLMRSITCPATPARPGHLSCHPPVLLMPAGKPPAPCPHPPAEKRRQTQGVARLWLGCLRSCATALPVRPAPQPCTAAMKPTHPGRAGGPAVAAAHPRFGSAKHLPAILGPADKNREWRDFGNQGIFQNMERASVSS